MVVPDHDLRNAGHDASDDRRLEVRPVLQHTYCWRQEGGENIAQGHGSGDSRQPEQQLKH